MKMMLTAAVVVSALAPASSGLAQKAPDRLLNAPYVTSTGATVANPGKSQSGGTTRLDREIQRENNKIDRSICKGC